MTTFNFSALAHEQTVAFNPAVDVLHFDDPAISAAQINISGASFAFTDFFYGSKTVTIGAAPNALTSTCITFQDGSQFLLGDNSVNTANDAGANTLIGGAGDDFIIGLEGPDSLVGGGGDDVFVMFASNPNFGNDTIDGGAGIDRLSYYSHPEAFGAFVNLATGIATGYGSPGSTITFASIEQVYANLTADTLVGSNGDDELDGGGGDDSIVGGAGNDTLYGQQGSDTLIGGAGSDFLSGGLGDDYYVVDDTFGAAEVFEDPGEGEDTIESGVAITLPANVEGFVFTGSGPLSFTGNSLDNVIAGSAFDDAISGAEGEDTVSYAYKTGAVVIDLSIGVATGSGTDTLSSFEHAQGGGAADLLIGNASGNVLDGGGGADTLQGGSGNDVYVVDSLADVIVETSNAPGGLLLPGAGAGGSLSPLAATLLDGITDTVIAAIDYSLENLEFIENLTLAGNALTGIGNALDNVMTGNALANTLSGGAGNDSIFAFDSNDSIVGGDGNDTVQGNAGNDMVRGATGNDEVRGGQGDDTLQAGAGLDVLRGALGNDEMRGGPDNDQMFGGQGNDTQFGGQGNDLLQGLLGNDVLQGLAGNDTLTGGGGLDQFWFNNAGPTNADTITDFDVGGEADTIVLQVTFFSVLPLGALDAGRFVSGAGAAAADADDYILYDTATGNLSYDADGNGGGASQLIATLTGAPSITAADLFVVA